MLRFSSFPDGKIEVCPRPRENFANHRLHSPGHCTIACAMQQNWDIPAAISLYNIDRWGTGYFTINERGNIQVQPTRGPASIDLMELIEEAKQRGLTFPIVLRFQDLLRDRVETINKSFAAAMKEANYRNEYRGVFPIKVNQLREVVEEIVDAGAPYHFGIEAGSKP